ncbi:SCO4225 family membrane protein [Actinoplanes sichuanensis]|uniref:SCO4225 family membrane protein n=1 Tax=Actinoplanes sichuanensis TaxID=512349 RepID=A0ABW4AS39_9ACTN|nr:hypothetical protein [Actinoplanes sichuanensis]
MTFVRWVVGGWFSRAYLVVVVAATVWAFVSVARWGQPDADLEVIWPMLLTGPVSWLLFAVMPGAWADSDVVFVACLSVGALANAVVIDAVVRQIRRARASYDVPLVDDHAAETR